MENNNSGWYEPLGQETAEPAVQQPLREQPAPSSRRPVRKGGGFWRVLLAVVMILALLVSSSLLFARLGRSSLNVSVNNNGDVHSFAFGGGSDSDSGDLLPPDEGAKDDGFTFTLPFTDPSQDEGGEDSDALPDNKDDFFSTYFSPAETNDVTIDADRYEGKLSISLALDEERGEKLTLQELYAECSPSVVTIITYQNKIVEFGLGTGIIASSDGLVLTNTHVIDECDRITVKLSDETVHEAKLVGADSSSDIAVLKIEAKGLHAATFGDSDALQIGEEVAAIGNPLSESFRLTLTNGIISGIDRGVSFNGRTMTVLQTNTALNNGNSGGPLFNMYGQVVGITNMKMASTLYTSVEGIGFAIPTRNALPIANALIDDGEVRGRTSIGITVGAVPEEAVQEYDIPFGLYITAVTEGTDAEAKGLLPGDIVTHVNGNEVRTTDDILTEKEGLLVGDSMTFTIYRESTGETFDVEIVLMDTLDVYG